MLFRYIETISSNITFTTKKSKYKKVTLPTGGDNFQDLDSNAEFTPAGYLQKMYYGCVIVSKEMVLILSALGLSRF